MRIGLIVASLLVPSLSFAKSSCPAPVKEAVAKAYPASRVSACKQEKVGGKVQYEVRLKTSEGRKLEVDVAPEGAILLTEEKIAVSALPSAVSAAFAARYPKIKATAAEKQTKADGKSSYELAFKANGKKKEATFDESGNFVSEE